MKKNKWNEPKWNPNELDGKDKCPDCGEEFQNPYTSPRCICRDPLFIVIQPGQHIHIQCPVHGDVKIYGPRMHWLQPMFGKTKTLEFETEIKHKFSHSDVRSGWDT